MAASTQESRDEWEGFFGAGLLLSQVYLLGVGVAVYALQWVLTGHVHLVSTILYTLISGNAITLLLGLAAPLYSLPSPRNWVSFLALLLPFSLAASVLGGVLSRFLLRTRMDSLLDLRNGDIPFATLILFVLGLANYALRLTRVRMEDANRALAEQVQHGRQEIATHASELQAAFDIQSSLLPRTVPQIGGVEISCAWQPARTVSGDFFDVLVLDENRIGFCLADVSGKGMSAALITANIQATFRAFAPEEPSPANLCRRLNAALCANLPQGRFVTFAYAILDRQSMALCYELAGHNPPTLLRGERAIALEGTGPVLGLLPGAQYDDHVLILEQGTGCC